MMQMASTELGASLGECGSPSGLQVRDVLLLRGLGDVVHHILGDVAA